MDSINDVLNAAKQYCREHTSEATYQYYISDIKAVSFENSNTITLEIRNAFILSIVSDRYATTLKDAFKSVLGFDVDLKFVTPKEGGDEEGKEKKPRLDEKSLPSGRYDFTFENFIKGPSNQFAYAAAQAVAANPSGAYNPLFIYGPSGLGKTHLLNAIQVEIKKNHPDFNIVYVDCEMFTNEIITAVKTATTEQFRDKYRKADVLLIDDIQFLAGKAQRCCGVHRQPFEAEHPPAGRRREKIECLLHAGRHCSLYRCDDHSHQGYTERQPADPGHDRKDPE